MTQIKYTKTELRSQQIKLGQLEKYLPTLQLKKAMLQLEIHQVAQEMRQLEASKQSCIARLNEWKSLLTDPEIEPLFEACKVTHVTTGEENIAGVEVPVFEKVDFAQPPYFLFDTPYWLDDGIVGIRELIEMRERIRVMAERKRRLEKELRDVSIRVNLFEKIMIPRTRSNIKKIKIFLGDQQLAAVSQAKASKRKILQRKELRR